MRVLHLNGSDEVGRRFNGFDIHDSLLRMGVESSLGCFWSHTASEPWVFNPFPGRAIHTVARAVKLAESISGHQSRFQFWSDQLFKHPRFLEADLVHLQVIHDYWFRLETIDSLSRAKPTLWSWHDLWPVAGHCISPVGCPRWSEGCGHCPDLRAPLRVARDRTAAEYVRKHDLIRKLDLDITVATEWSLRQIAPHLEGSSVRPHVLPFGIDTSVFRPRDSAQLRSQYGIPDDSLVVMARSTADPQKGFIPLVDTLESLSDGHNITLLTVHEVGIAAKHSARLNVIEMPWVSTSEDLASLMAASDVFAMPSTGESFGMMALEAMACGLPVVHVADTATAEVVNCPELAVDPTRFAESLATTLDRALSDPSALRAYGAAARKRAEAEYGMAKYLHGLVSLYRAVIGRHGK